MPQLRRLVPVEEVFPHLALTWHDFSQVLRRLSRTDTIFHLGRLGAVVSKAGPATILETQQRALAFIGADPERGKRLDAHVLANPNQRFHPFSRGMLLELLRWVALLSTDKPQDGKTFEGREARNDLLAALLMAGQLWTRRVFARHDPRSPPNDEEGLAIRMVELRRAYIENMEAVEAPHLFGRALAIMEDFLPRRFPRFPALFEAETGVPLGRHLLFTLTMYQLYVEGTQLQPAGMQSNIGLFDVTELGTAFVDPRDGELLRRFVDRASYPISALTHALWPHGPPRAGQQAMKAPPPFDLTPIRTRPIAVAPDGRGIIIDPHLFGDLALTGPVFMAGNDSMKLTMACYGKAFEDYCISILERVFPEGKGMVRPLGTTVELAPEKKKKKKVMGEFDALLRHQDCALCFEAKHAFLPDDLLRSGQERSFLQVFSERYADPKGARQLAESLKYLARQPQAAWPPLLRGARVFFPILVVSDTRLDDVCAQHLLGSFEKHIGASASEGWHPYPKLPGVNEMHVAPLIVCNVADLEYLEEISRRRTICEVFSSYAIAKRSSTISFGHFLRTHHEYGKMIGINRHLLSRVENALRDAQRIFFGDARDSG